MFESSLIPQRRGKEARLLRFIALSAVAAQAVAVGAFVIGPLVWPDKLPAFIRPPQLVKVEYHKAVIIPIPPKQQPVHLLTTTAAVSAPSHSAPAVAQVRRGAAISRNAPTALDDAPPLTLGGGTMAGPFTLASGLGSLTGISGVTGPAVVSAAPGKPAAPAGPLNVSSGVSAGLLLQPIKPLYPPIAIAAGIEGTVTITAIIDRTGHIINIKVTGGPQMLQKAAADAVREARYKPFMLNGQPTEVITTVSVTFRRNV